MRYGFSLVELSIVLVILGLLTGGILTGQSLIRASELRSVHVDAQRYLAAVYTFKDKYFLGPGDLNNATSFWGKDSTNCNGDIGTANSSTGTCNGNGDGQVLNTNAGAGTTQEIFQFWRHLANAGLVEGTYTGIVGPSSANHSVPGTNIPRARLTNGAWGFVSYIAAGATPGGVADVLTIPIYGKSMTLGSQTATGGPGGPLLKPEESWNIDTKMDDGHPGRGRVIGKFYNNLCMTQNSGAAVTTNLDVRCRLEDSANTCALFFVNLF